VPFLDSDPFLRWCDTGKDFSEALLAMLREVNGHCVGVDDPTKNELDCTPRAVNFSQLLDGKGLLSGRGVDGRQGTKDLVDDLEQCPTYTALILFALAKSNKIVDEYVHIGKGLILSG